MSRMKWPELFAVELKQGGEAYEIHNVCPSWKFSGHSIPDGALLRMVPNSSDWSRWVLRQPSEWYDHEYEDPSVPAAIGNRRAKSWTTTLATLTHWDFIALDAYAQLPDRYREILDGFRAPDVASLPSVILVKEDRPGCGLRAGDIIHRPDDRALVLPGTTRPVPREHQEPMREALKAGALGDLTPWMGKNRSTKTLIKDARLWGRRKRVWEPMLEVTRPFDCAVSEPIEAQSDAAAIFELLHSVGCAMPS